MGGGGTSGGGFATSGFLQGFAQSYNQAWQRRSEAELAQRGQLSAALMSMYQNSRPEAQQEILQRVAQIATTPWGKKIDKKLGDVTTLGQAAAQSGQPQQAQAAQSNVAGMTSQLKPLNRTSPE